MIKSFKVMLVPNNEQRTRLFQFAGSARFAYNWALEKEINAFKNEEKFISHYDLRKEFTLLRNSAEYSWLKKISNNVTKQAIIDLDTAYKKFFQKKASYPKFKSKRKGDFSFYQDTAKIKITETHVKLESIALSKRKNRQKLNWIKLFDRKPIYLLEVITTLIGNFVGTFLLGFILKFTRIYQAISLKAQGICTIKLDDNMISILILSILCGMLMYLAVDVLNLNSTRWKFISNVIVIILNYIASKILIFKK